jgi:hypothetical protein
VRAGRLSTAAPCGAVQRHSTPTTPIDYLFFSDQVKAHLASREFQSKVAARKAKAAKRGGNRGIIMNAGGRKLLTSAVVTLAVLRRALNCTLPVELVWHSDKEMDRSTLAALAREFGPLRGYNVAAEPFPKHHRRE